MIGINETIDDRLESEALLRRREIVPSAIVSDSLQISAFYPMAPARRTAIMMEIFPHIAA